MADLLVGEDLIAIKDFLDNLADLGPFSPSIVFHSADDDDPYPLIVLIDAGTSANETFGYGVASEDAQYIIRVITPDTVEKHASEIAFAIHRIITDNLHGNKIPVSGGFKTLMMKRGPRELSHEEHVSSNEVYLHTGFKWFASFGK